MALFGDKQNFRGSRSNPPIRSQQALRTSRRRLLAVGPVEKEASQEQYPPLGPRLLQRSSPKSCAGLAHCHCSTTISWSLQSVNAGWSASHRRNCQLDNLIGCRLQLQYLLALSPRFGRGCLLFGTCTYCTVQ